MAAMRRRGHSPPSPARHRFAPVRLHEQRPVDDQSLTERITLIERSLEAVRPLVDLAVAHGFDRRDVGDVLVRALYSDHAGDLHDRLVAGLAASIAEQWSAEA